MKPYLTIGVIGKSLKENEKRVAIHPDHLYRIPQELRENITFEAEEVMKQLEELSKFTLI